MSKAVKWLIAIAIFVVLVGVFNITPAAMLGKVWSWLAALGAFVGLGFGVNKLREKAPDIINRLKKTKEADIAKTSDDDLAGRIDRQ